VQDAIDRERSIAAYATEVRAFHAFFGAVLLLLGVLHLFVLLPFMQLRTAAPALAAALDAAVQETSHAAEGEKAVGASTAATAQFRRALDTAPGELRRAIGDLVARGRLMSGLSADPYKAPIRVPKEGAPGNAGPVEEEQVLLEEAVRREVGRRVERLSTTFDAAIEPLRPMRDSPPEIADVVRTAEEGLGRNVLALNEVLREAFAADPNFWQRMGPGSTFAPASARAEQWAKGTAEAQRLLETRLATATNTLKSRRQAAQARAAALDERNQELRARLDAFSARLAWLPLGLGGWVRLYPLIAGGLALTALFRLRRILLLRRTLSDIDLDVMAPSWVLGASSAPGRWWALILVSLPVAGMIYAAIAALRDPGLFTGVLGEPSPLTRTMYGLTYLALTAVGAWQLLLVSRGIFAQHLRPAGSSARTAER
jgi:hypothetical protein